MGQVRLVGRGEANLVCKKLCSTLTTYFVRTPVPWIHSLRHLTLSFARGEAVTPGDVEASTAQPHQLLESLNANHLTALLWFAGDLAEQVGKVDANVSKHSRLHEQMKVIVQDASLLMHWSFLRPPSEDGDAVRTQALRCFLTWINYAQPVWPRDHEALTYLRNLVEEATRCFLNETLYYEALDIFRDILESYTSFFRPQHMGMLARVIHDQLQPKLLGSLLDQSSNDAVITGQFITAYGCAVVKHIVEHPEDEVGSVTVIRLHLNMLSAEGYPGDDDLLSAQSLEFWNTYVEYANDTVFSKESGAADPEWLPSARQVLSQVVELIWQKMWIPPHEIAAEWSLDEADAFKEFRVDASDLVQSIFILLRNDILRSLLSVTLQSLKADQWNAIEASLLLLNALAEDVLEDRVSEDLVAEIFRSGLFSQIADFELRMPSQVRRTAIDMLGSYGEYMERHTEFLPDTLRFLFASLEAAGLANVAAKSISSLCSANRVSLTSELDGFLMQYQRFLESATAEPYTKEKVIGAIAAIVQACSPESAKVPPLLALLDNVNRDIVAARQYSADGDSEMAELMGVTALECLASIGKQLQAQSDVPINIYDDNETSTNTSYWQGDEGRQVQQSIVSCLSVLEILPNSSAAIDAACHVLRSGFQESEPGPFVLPASVTVNFLQQCTINTPQLSAVLSTACMLVTQQSRSTSQRSDDDVSGIYQSVVGLIRTLGQPKADPEVAMGCIDIATRMIPHFLHLLLQANVAILLDFVLVNTEEPSTLPKRAACNFWVKFIAPQTSATTPDVQQSMTQVLDAYGPRLAAALMRQFGGQAMRSDLEFLCEPLKALLLHQRQSQSWLQDGLASIIPANQAMGSEEKSKFLRQLAASRGDGRKMKELSREFWAVCHGTVVRYG